MSNDKIFSGIPFTVLLFAILLAVIFILDHFAGENLLKSKHDRTIDFISSVIEVEFDNDPVAEKMSVVSEDNGEIFDIYPVRLNGMVNTVVVKVINNKGYGGHLEVLIAFLMDGTISGYRVITHNETVGLGSKIEDEEFSSQFKFMHPERENIMVKKDGGEVDAVTSATISSRAVVSSLQMGYNAYQRFLMGY